LELNFALLLNTAVSQNLRLLQSLIRSRVDEQCCLLLNCVLWVISMLNPFIRFCTAIITNKPWNCIFVFHIKPLLLLLTFCCLCCRGLPWQQIFVMRHIAFKI
jgi:hypothetical protein